jgi:hypothetical protein
MYNVASSYIVNYHLLSLINVSNFTYIVLQCKKLQLISNPILSHVFYVIVLQDSWSLTE